MPTTHTTPIDLRGFHGREFEGVINDHDNNDVICKGKICIDKLGDVYLCQNKAKGIRTEDTLGFDYSWIAQESNESLWSTPSVKSITILDPLPSIDPRWDWKDGEEVVKLKEKYSACRIHNDIVVFIRDGGATGTFEIKEAYDSGFRKLPSPPNRKLTEITEEMFDKTNLIGRKVIEFAEWMNIYNTHYEYFKMYNGWKHKNTGHQADVYIQTSTFYSQFLLWQKKQQEGKGE